MRKSTTLLLLSITLCTYAKPAESPHSSTPNGEIAGHGYVDLGLPSGTLWATCNINAESPYHPGQYFAWGETTPRDRFIWYDYKFFEKEYTDDDGRLNYSASDIGQEISGTEYDAARSLWGDEWRMPTKEDWEELMEYCTAEYLEYSYIPPKSGLRICGPNGNSIILPQTFSPHSGFDFAIAVEIGEYWTATESTARTDNNHPSAMMLSFSPTGYNMKLIPDSRHDGLSIRPVTSNRNISTSVATLTDSTPAIKYENGLVSINGYTDGCELTVSDLSGRHICSCLINDNICELPTLSKGIYIIDACKADKILTAIKIIVK